MTYSALACSLSITVCANCYFETASFSPPPSTHPVPLCPARARRNENGTARLRKTRSGFVFIYQERGSFCALSSPAKVFLIEQLFGTRAQVETARQVAEFGLAFVSNFANTRRPGRGARVRRGYSVSTRNVPPAAQRDAQAAAARWVH